MHVGVTGSSRLVFFSALYKCGAATPTDYAQMLKYLVLGGPPCICRLLALQTVVGSGDRHVHRFCESDVSLVVDTLRQTDHRGYKVWELGGERKAASEMLRGVLDKIQGWRKA
ncbi:hypothetical protein PENSPDRAFT_611103 [Peniophora sp. CONT]|nr:hypothetical protein PENSPDRAFT_611103 [Peniophora sp. CONT]